LLSEEELRDAQWPLSEAGLIYKELGAGSACKLLIEPIVIKGRLE